MKQILLVKDDFINSRLDRWFKKNIQKVPQSLIEKNIRRGNIKVNYKKSKSSYRLKKKTKLFYTILILRPQRVAMKNIFINRPKKICPNQKVS